jgi:hypothetical protein
LAHASYLKFDEYQSYGGALDQTAFLHMEFKARKRIDYLTDSRVQGMAEVPESVKFCAFALIGMEAKAGAEAQVASPAVTSFSTDGYSESYGNALDADAAQDQMSKLAGRLLYGEKDDLGIPLLYRGVRG